MKPKYQLGKGSRKVYDSGLHLDCKMIINTALGVVPIDFTLVSGLRTASGQRILWEIGRRYDFERGSMERPESWVETGAGVVTYCDGYIKQSRHQSGKAFDVQCYIPGRPDLSYDKIHMAVLIGSFLTIADMLFREGEITHRLRSGADWDRDTQYLEPGTFVDMPHLELIEP